MEYLGEKNAGELIRQSFSLYFRNFGRLYPIFLVTVLPAGVLFALVQVSEAAAVLIVGFVAMIMVSLIGAGAFTVAISDLCLGRPVSIGHAYKRMFSGLVGKLLWTFLLIMVASMIGYVLLLVPGLIFSAMVIVAVPVVVLERIGGFAALKRAIQLGKGKHARNFGLVLLLTLIIVVFNMAIGAGAGVITGLTAPDIIHDIERGRGEFGAWLFYFIVFEVTYLIAPVQSVLPALIYYDLRSRKEAYDIAALERDLIH